MSLLVSVLYKQNLYLLLTAVSLGVCGERSICPGIRIKIKGHIAGGKTKKDSSKKKGKCSAECMVKFLLFIC